MPPLTMPTLFAISIEPRVYETDLLGHINNVALSGWIETGRVRFMETIERGTAAAASGAWVIASLTLDFVAETQYGLTATLGVTQVDFGNTSMTIYSEVSQAGATTVRSKSVMVHVCADSREKRPVPETMKQRVRRLLDE